MVRSGSDLGGAKGSFLVISMRITFPLLDPHADVDMAEGRVLKHIYVAMSNVPVSTSEAFHGAQVQRLSASTIETSFIASPLSVESRYFEGIQMMVRKQLKFR